MVAWLSYTQAVCICERTGRRDHRVGVACMPCRLQQGTLGAQEIWVCASAELRRGKVQFPDLGVGRGKSYTKSIVISKHVTLLKYLGT